MNYPAYQLNTTMGGATPRGDGLAETQHLLIEQRTDWAECCCPCFCETANKYELYVGDSSGEVKNARIGEFEESDSCISKFCCQCWRPWKLRMISSSGTAPIDAERGCFIPQNCCCPFMREEVTVSQSGVNIGRIHSPYNCGRTCFLCPWEELDVYDSSNNLKYIISGNCCQLGAIARSCACCRCCGPCKFIHYKIMDPNKQELGEIKNIYHDCVTEVCTKADKFIVTFPDTANYNDKVLLSYAAIIIDYDHFENTCCNAP